MQPPNHAWDTRAWLLGIVGGGVSAAGFTAAISLMHNTMLNAFLPGAADWACVFFGGLSALVLPAILSGTARRWTFLWGLIPPTLTSASICAEQWVKRGWDGLEDMFWVPLLIGSVCFFVSSGSVSLIRWLRVRAARRHAVLLASHQAQRGAASTPQEGVWPPPPEYRE